MAKELHYSKLKCFYNSNEMKFSTTDEISINNEIIGQERGARALDFGLNVKMKGYNIYVSGQSGTGKTTYAKEFAESHAINEAIPDDLCYIYNFKNPKSPKVLRMTAGAGEILKEDMEELISKLQKELPKVFSTKEFENKKTEIIKVYQLKRDDVIKEMTAEAKEQNFGVKTTNTGIYFMPIVKGEVISEEQFDELSQDEKDFISVNSESIQKSAADAMRLIKDFEKSTRKGVIDLEYSIGLFTVGYHVSRIMEKYENDAMVTNYLLEVKEDILTNIEDFFEQDSEDEESIQSILPWYSKRNSDDTFSKYKINVLTNNKDLKGAPVILDFNPTYSNLVGEIEYDNEYGNLTTDFMKIKPGLFHKANGGYLILKAYDVLTNIHAWEAIRRILLTKEIIIEPLREYTTGLPVSGIKPEPVELDIKIILIGTGFFYGLLYDYDDEFQKLFKICVDFDYEMNFNDKNVSEMVGFIKKFVVTNKTFDFDAGAVAKIIEYSSRLAERQDKLTTRFNDITEILAESYTWAKLEKDEIVLEKHIIKAITEKEYRLSMYEEKLTDMIEQNVIMLDTVGKKVGQINGLAVIDTGDYAFATPTKITATTYVGKAGIVNIEKEADMSGSIHEKGIQVLIGYLGQTYAQEFPLSLSCRICFEQNYNGIDGDSASSTELYAVLSSLSEYPINCEIAVTGSINQRGEIQPIGGVSYKIEGFYNLCEKRGLTGKQGVMIPVQNIMDLVLKDNVIEAVKDGMFHIYPISHIDEGIEILTGVEAGKLNEKGKYPTASVHGKVYKKLKDFYKKSMAEE